MGMIQRFNLRTELYEEVLKQPHTLDFMDYFLRPLFMKPLEKTYNLNKSIELQRPISKRKKKKSFLPQLKKNQWKPLSLNKSSNDFSVIGIV